MSLSEADYNVLPKISVIVPVYNTEKYLRRCIDSILAQTFTDFELLLIDDGSKDSSGAICDEYAAKDSRVRVFHKENGGVSSARNVGLDNAKGEWITFVDADDWIEPPFLDNLIFHSGYDLVMSYYVADGWKGWVSKPYQNEVFTYSRIPVFLERYLISCNVPWCKLIRRNLIEYHAIRFDVRYSYGEDTLFIMDCMRYVKNIAIDGRQLYHYDCTNVNSLSNKKIDIDVQLELIDSIAKHINFISASFKWDSAITKNSIIRLISNRLFNYETCCSKSDLKKICLNKNVINIINDKSLKKSVKRKLFDWLILRKAYIIVFFLMQIISKLKNGKENSFNNAIFWEMARVD